MDEHRLFAAGKFQDLHNGKRLNELEWSELASTFNEMEPAKTVDQWKKCWRNEKCVARKINAAWKKCLNKTENSSNNLPPVPNDRQRLILSIIGTETSGGIGTGEIGFDENGIVINEFEMYIDNTKWLEDLQDMVELSNSDPVGGGFNSIAEQNIVGVHKSEKLVSSTSKVLSRTDIYKNSVDETNGALKNMTDAIKENTAQMGSIMHAINNMSNNLINLTQAINNICSVASNLLPNNK